MARTKQKPKTGKHWRIVFYYARAYQPTFYSELAARRFIEAKGLTSSACHYTELWKMFNETDGEQIGCWENSQRILAIEVE